MIYVSNVELEAFDEAEITEFLRVAKEFQTFFPWAESGGPW